ncbi:amino acid adenylation domain-containing protein [Piscinibacter terrae]|uniref:Amino acid adenylation domain-containing protein n=1 Tax=Piscinibacter terrae TaxID=2496871 RepID=A0A3N7HVE6_9BURK|nr:amino acid adenylation domain-containing protein [Albitalea terrae]RQP26340.1 amino acid adenylation domain-containing protein [Albitalea terrae]
MQSPNQGRGAQARDAHPSHPSTSEIAWFELPADLGRCDDQAARIEAETRLNAGPQGWKHGVVACFATLLHRHTNQSSLALAVVDAQEPLRVVGIEFEDGTLLSQVIGACQAAAPAPAAATPSTVCLLDAEANPLAGSAPLALACSADGDALRVRLSFDGRLFRAERMSELLAQLGVLWDQACRDANRPVLTYSLMTDLGRRLLPDPSQPIEVPRYPLMPEAFAAMAASRPDDVAIRKAGRTWSYREVDRSSSALAATLCGLGVTPSDVVVVTGPRSFGTVSSVLGTFRSGATLLTIDPKLPLDRQRVMVQQASARFMVRIGPSSALDGDGLQVIEIDPDSGLVKGAAPGAVSQSALPDLVPSAPAYIFFTSGSTGVPKGVVGCHQGLAHFLDWQRKTFEIGPGDRAAQITTLSFDMVLRDMFLALTSGATLSIPEEADVLDPGAILSWMASERISVLHVVPSLLRAWINNAPEGLKLPALRRVFLAGEPLTDSLIKSFRASFGEKDALVTNFYGPTETTLIKCFHPVLQPEPGVQPVGRPQPQTQIVILNRAKQVCGVHELGEIAIRTPFRTLGYLNAPETTAKVFVPNPFSDQAGDLLYMTGDSGCYRADGLIVMRGRMDNQVKIRGVRVEPGEIEAAIGHCPGVKEAAVVAHEGEQGKYLVAYVVFSASQPTSSVRDFLRARLPENMVPSAFVVLDALPLLPNGKVNRKALTPPAASPEPATAPLDAADAPRNAREAELIAIWQSVLGHGRVGVNDSFVELGGDSLTAITALVRMQRLGIPDGYARGIFQGWSIRQIVQMAEGKAPVEDMGMPPKVRTNLFVNVMRGVLVAILVAGHWFEGLLNRLPDAWHGVGSTLMPLFNAATPGFALMFGLSLGYIFLPRYASEPQAATKTLRQAMWLVIGGVFVRAAFDIGMLVSNGVALDSTLFFTSFYSALLYYAIALATAPWWFRLITRSSNVYRTVFLMAVAAHFIYQGFQWLFLEQQRTGFVELMRLMVVAKFNYFNMSAGALCGLAGGYYLHEWSQGKHALSDLSQRLGLAGLAATVFGLGLLYQSTGSFEQIQNAAIMPLWKWIFYGGTVLLMASLLSVALNAHERLPAPARVGFNLLGVLGQLSLPIFVCHNLVLRIKGLLVHWGMPGGPALIIPLAMFFGGFGWVMAKLYALYYGSVSGAASKAQEQPAGASA